MLGGTASPSFVVSLALDSAQAVRRVLDHPAKQQRGAANGPFETCCRYYHCTFATYKLRNCLRITDYVSVDASM